MERREKSKQTDRRPITYRDACTAKDAVSIKMKDPLSCFLEMKEYVDKKICAKFIIEK